MEALLVLEDGATFVGESVGAPGRALGEVVFSTSMTGYQEMLTDPSYRGQILTLTYPLIGNYGVTPSDSESGSPQAAGFIVRQLCDDPSNWRAPGNLREYLRANGIVAVAGLDTRALTRRLRAEGVMMGALSTEETAEEALSRLRAAPSYASIDFVREVSARSPYQWNDSYETTGGQFRLSFQPAPRVAVVDYGLKRNILRNLSGLAVEPIVVPCDASAAEVLALKPEGVVLSPGPGNPELLGYAIATVRELIGKVPIMGICLGHQLLALAVGGRTFKLRFGHRGANHPVKDLASGRVHITSQNHGFAVDADSLTGTGLEVSQVNLNDGTVEGLRHRSLPIFSVQYHPEASSGPLDSRGLFEEFLALLGA